MELYVILTFVYLMSVPLAYFHMRDYIKDRQEQAKYDSMMWISVEREYNAKIKHVLCVLLPGINSIIAIIEVIDYVFNVLFEIAEFFSPLFKSIGKLITKDPNKFFKL